MTGAITTFIAILKSVAATFLTTDATTALHRSAIFLILFLVVHMIGNLFIFFGQEVFNTYGYFLHINPLLKFIEAYLALAFVFHGFSGCYKTYKKKRNIVKAPFTQGRLLISSLIVTFFVVIHLKSFKFGTYYTYTAKGGLSIPLKGSVEKGTEMRDIYRLALEVFNCPIKTWIYIVSISVLGFHLYSGWEKTIRSNYIKMGLNKNDIQAAIVFGHAVTVLLTVGFLSSPIYVHYFLSKEFLFKED